MSHLGEIFNGDFEAPPGDVTANIDEENALPGHIYTQASGTSITASVVADSAQAFGYKVRFTMASGAAGHETYFEQLVPVQANFAYRPTAYTFGGANCSAFIDSVFLLADGTTTTGTAATRLTAPVAVATTLTSLPNGTGVAPTDAVFLRIRWGGVRTASTSGTCDFYRLTLLSFSDALMVTDRNDPTAFDPILFTQIGGSAVLDTPGAADLTIGGGSTLVFFGSGGPTFTDGIVSADIDTLDAYRENTFTPGLSFTTAGNQNIVLSTAVGRYTRVGNRCIVVVAINTSTFTHTTASGNLQITGLPFTIVNVTASGGNASLIASGWTKAGVGFIAASFPVNTTVANLQYGGTGIAIANFQHTEFLTGASVVLRMSGVYEVED